MDEIKAPRGAIWAAGIFAWLLDKIDRLLKRR